MPSDAATSSGMHPGLDRVHRPQPHRLERLVVQLAAVVLAHTALSQKQKVLQVDPDHVRGGGSVGGDSVGDLLGRGQQLPINNVRRVDQPLAKGVSLHRGGRAPLNARQIDLAVAQ